MKDVTWADWDSIHNLPDQQKRLSSACKAPCTPISLNPEQQTGVFSGSSGVYQTSLTQCTCIDFSRRHKPCKHMYRLAIELGVYGDKKDLESDAFSRKIPRAELREITIDFVSRIENCPEAAQKELQFILLEFLYRKHNDPFYYKDGAIVKPLIEIGLLDCSSLDRSECYAYFIKKMKKKEMLSAIQSQGDALPADCKLKRDIALWMIAKADKYGPLLFTHCLEVKPSRALLRVAPSIYKYLHRKFDKNARMELYYDPNTDEMIQVKKELPDDFETGLLHMFGTYPVN